MIKKNNRGDTPQKQAPRDRMHGRFTLQASVLRRMFKDKKLEAFLVQYEKAKERKSGLVLPPWHVHKKTMDQIAAYVGGKLDIKVLARVLRTNNVEKMALRLGKAVMYNAEKQRSTV